VNDTLQNIVKKKADYKSLYTFISQVNKNIVRVHDENALFRNACRIATRFGNFKMAWIGLFDKPHKKINLVDQSGMPAEAAKLFCDARYDADGPQEFVLSQGIHYICNNVEQKFVLERWKSFAAKYGINSVMVLPIKKAGEIIGTFNLYSAKHIFSEEEEIELLVGVAEDISFALDLFEKTKQQKASEELLVRNERSFLAMIEKSTDMLLLSTINGELLYGSPSITKICGYTLEEFKNKPAIEFIHPEDIGPFIENRITLSKTPGESMYYQQRILHKNGQWLWCEGTDTNMLEVPGVNAMVSNFRDITERKLSQQQHEFDKNNLLALINNTNDLIWSVDREFNLITANQRFGEMVKLMSGDTIKIGSNVLSSGFSREKLKSFKDNYERAFAGETFLGVEYSDFPVEYWAEISFYPLRKGDEVIGAACYAHDITERKKAERSLIKSEKRYRQIVETAQEGIWVIDVDNKTVFVNQKMCDTLGYTREEMIGRTNLSFKDPGEQKRALERIERRKRGIVENNESSFITKSGRHIVTQVATNPILDDDGVYMGALAMITDITEAKATEQRLAHSESRLKEAQAMAHIGNFEVDPRTGAEVWSDEMYKIYGIDKDEVTPSKDLFLSFIHPDDCGGVKEAMQQCLKTFQTSIANFRFIRKDESLRYGYSEANFELDKNGAPVRIYGIFQDVTEAKLAEIERIKIVNDLMQRNNDLEQFAYIVSHNLRAPVANIIGASSLLNDMAVDDEDKELLSRGIHESINRLDEVVKDLNAILQVKGEINGIKEIVNFSELAEGVKLSINNLIDNDNIEVKYDFSEVNEFLTIKSYLYSIFYNLISNSVKYRQLHLYSVIEIKSILENGKIELTFKDNGTGFDQQKKGGEVFGLYKRFHNNIEGKGMGLFMVKTQVETLGGTISVKSIKNEGTEFKIEFAI